MGLIKEFKEFISKGSVIDMAVGVVIGGAFSKIVDSMVSNLIMPIVGYLTAGIDFSNIKTILKVAEGEAEEVAILWGSFIEAVISFLIIALVIFFMLKGINKLRKKKEEEAAPAGPSDNELLTDILVELKKKNSVE